ncbi:MAG: DUF2786 domain-containing protein [Selenomonadaceae bacterium]|nr:DUF2786 domain-containing protein [Selenomonadaceae bacterium]
MEKQDVLKKIAAMMNLTVENGATEHEAIAAATMAQKLIAKYHVDITELEMAKAPADDKVDVHEAPAVRRWESLLATVVGNNMRCEVVSHYENRRVTIKIIGSETDRLAAVETFNMLQAICREGIKRRKAAAKHTYGSAAGIEMAYAWGFITGVKNEMERQAMALMLVIPDNVKDYFNDIPNIRKRRTHAPDNVNRATYEAQSAGYADGAMALGQRKLNGKQ